jgi:hypothetical protein
MRCRVRAHAAARLALAGADTALGQRDRPFERVDDLHHRDVCG